MKKTINAKLFVLAIFLVLMAPLAFADENEVEGLDNETKDVEIMQTQYGIELKLLHLKEALDVKISEVTNLIETIGAKNESTTELESTLAEFQALRDEANTYLATDSDIVQKIIASKQKAMNLTKEVKALAKDKLTNDEKRTLQVENAQVRKETRDQYRDEIKTNIENLNSQRLVNFMEKHGITNETIKQKLLSKEITPAEALKMLKDDVKKLKPEQKDKLKQKIAEDRTKRKVNAEAAKEKAKQIRVEHEKKIKEKAKAKIEENREKFKARIESIKENRQENAKRAKALA